MPRIATSLLRKAYALDPFLPALLAPCRDLHSAQNELRWLREHAEKVAKSRQPKVDQMAEATLLRRMVRERASGKPLQYILGTAYFGDLEIRCSPGVLIPRAETAASVSHLTNLLRLAKNLPPKLRVLDLCTGTGCIPLLFQHELSHAHDDADLDILGVDISDAALRLSNCNLRNVRKSKQFIRKDNVSFLQADVLVDQCAIREEDPMAFKTALNYHGKSQLWDVLISNPPYISPSAYWKTTTRSVRGFEPKLALVPPSKATQNDTEQGDMFYPRLLDIADDVEAKIVLLEVADIEQARRVAQYAQDLAAYDGVEIWRDQPGANSDSTVEPNGITIVGEGNARSVLCWRGAGTDWLGRAAASSD